MSEGNFRAMETDELRRVYDSLRRGLMALPPEDRPERDLEQLLTMRKELDKREKKPVVAVEFEKYITK